jgi:hypothetical protein
VSRLAPAQVLDLYEWRQRAILDLSQREAITLADLPDERGLLCLVADDLWDLCDARARAFLLEHEHHFVRSSATIAATGSTAHA